MADTAKAEKLAAAKRRVEQMKKKKGGGKREPGTEVLSKQDQDDDGAGHLSETLLEVKSSASELPVTTDNSISIQEGLSLNSDVNLLGSLASSDNKIVHPKSEECENAQGQGNIQFSEIPQESESILHSEVSKDKKGLCEPLGKKSSDSEILQNQMDNSQERTDFSENSEIEEIQAKDNRELDRLRASHIESLQDVNVTGKGVSDPNSLTSKARDQVKYLEKAYEQARKECLDLRARLETVENENQGLRKDLDRLRGLHIHDNQNEGLDELENEVHNKLLKKIRDLENENSDLRRNLTHEPQEKTKTGRLSVLTSPGPNFTDIDLGAELPSRSRMTNASKAGLGNFITSGLSAITGANSRHSDDEGSIDELIDFDEEAFRKAKEVEANLRIERIKDIKRSLQRWKGWRLDLVESRIQFGDEFGEIFDV